MFLTEFFPVVAYNAELDYRRSKYRRCGNKKRNPGKVFLTSFFLKRTNCRKKYKCKKNCPVLSWNAITDSAVTKRTVLVPLIGINWHNLLSNVPGFMRIINAETLFIRIKNKRFIVSPSNSNEIRIYVAPINGSINIVQLISTLYARAENIFRACRVELNAGQGSMGWCGMMLKPKRTACLLRFKPKFYQLYYTIRPESFSL